MIVNAHSVCARAITEYQKIDKAQKGHDIYRLLFTLQLWDAEFNGDDDTQEIIRKYVYR